MIIHFSSLCYPRTKGLLAGKENFLEHAFLYHHLFQNKLLTLATWAVTPHQADSSPVLSAPSPSSIIQESEALTRNCTLHFA